MSFNQQRPDTHCVRVLRWPPSEGLASEKALQKEWKRRIFFSKPHCHKFFICSWLWGRQKRGQPRQGANRRLQTNLGFQSEGEGCCTKRKKTLWLFTEEGQRPSHAIYLFKGYEPTLVYMCQSKIIRVLSSAWYSTYDNALVVLHMIPPPPPLLLLHILYIICEQSFSCQVAF